MHGACRKVTKAVFCVVVSAALIGFAKGMIVGYLVGSHKAKHDWHNIKCTDKSDEVEEKEEMNEE